MSVLDEFTRKKKRDALLMLIYIRALDNELLQAQHRLLKVIFCFIRPQEPKAPVTYCDHVLSGVCPSVVRPSSVVRRPLDYLHFRLLLQNRLLDFDETWYGWSTQGPLQVLLFFGQIRPGADPGRGKNRSWGSPSSGNFFFSPGGYSNKPNA